MKLDALPGRAATVVRTWSRSSPSCSCAGGPRICRALAGGRERLAARSDRSGNVKALSVIHARYAEDLDVEGLAREAGVSRTVLGERFGELLGEPPMRYCARWRMRMAANMLRDGKRTPPTSLIRSASTARRRSTARSSANMAAAGDLAAADRGGGKPRDERTRGSATTPPTTTFAAAPRRRNQTRLCGGRERLPLVKAASWMSHLEVDWRAPPMAALGTEARAGDPLHPFGHARFRIVGIGAADTRFRAYGRGPCHGDRRRRGRIAICSA